MTSDSVEKKEENTKLVIVEEKAHHYVVEKRPAKYCCIAIVVIISLLTVLQLLWVTKIRQMQKTNSDDLSDGHRFDGAASKKGEIATGTIHYAYQFVSDDFLCMTANGDHFDRRNKVEIKRGAKEDQTCDRLCDEMKEACFGYSEVRDPEDSRRCILYTEPVHTTVFEEENGNDFTCWERVQNSRHIKKSGQGNQAAQNQNSDSEFDGEDSEHEGKPSNGNEIVDPLGSLLNSLFEGPQSPFGGGIVIRLVSSGPSMRGTRMMQPDGQMPAGLPPQEPSIED